MRGHAAPTSTHWAILRTGAAQGQLVLKSKKHSVLGQGGARGKQQPWKSVSLQSPKNLGSLELFKRLMKRVEGNMGGMGCTDGPRRPGKCWERHQNLEGLPMSPHVPLPQGPHSSWAL